MKTSISKKWMIPTIIIALVIIGGAWVVYGGVIKQQGAQLWGTLPFPKGVVSTTPLALPSGSCKGVTGPKVTVLSPNGGEIFTEGQQVMVNWSTCGHGPNESVEIGINGPLNSVGPHPLVYTVNDGSEMITIPTATSYPQMRYGNLYKIQIVVANQQDFSDNFVTINRACTPSMAPWIQVTYPNGGQIFQPGNQVLVRWNSCNVSATETVYLQVERTGNQFTWGKSPNDGSHMVTMPSNAATSWPGMPYGKNYKMHIWTSKPQTTPIQIGAEDWSDALWTIDMNTQI